MMSSSTRLRKMDTWIIGSGEGSCQGNTKNIQVPLYTNALLFYFLIIFCISTKVLTLCLDDFMDFPNRCFSNFQNSLHMRKGFLFTPLGGDLRHSSQAQTSMKKLH